MMFRSNLEFAGKLTLITALAFLPKMGQAEEPACEKEPKAATAIDQVDLQALLLALGHPERDISLRARQRIQEEKIDMTAVIPQAIELIKADAKTPFDRFWHYDDVAKIFQVSCDRKKLQSALLEAVKDDSLDNSLRADLFGWIKSDLQRQVAAKKKLDPSDEQAILAGVQLCLEGTEGIEYPMSETITFLLTHAPDSKLLKDRRSKFLKFPDPRVRLAATEYCLKHGIKAPDVLDCLAGIISQHPTSDRRRPLHSYSFQPEILKKALELTIQYKLDDPVMTQAYVTALKDIPRPPFASSLLTIGLLIDALSRVKVTDDKVILVLTESLSSEHRYVRWKALTTLKELGPAAQAALPKLEEALAIQKVISGPDEIVTWKAIGAIRGEEPNVDDLSKTARQQYLAIRIPKAGLTR